MNINQKHTLLGLILLLCGGNALAYVTVPSSDGDGQFTLTLTVPTYYVQVQVERRHESTSNWTTVGSYYAGTQTDTVSQSGTWYYRARGEQHAMGGPYHSDYGATDSINVTMVPEAPGSVDCSESPSYDGTYMISWSASPTSTRYEWREKNSNNSNWPAYQSNGMGMSIMRDNGNGSYDYQVRACNGAGCSGHRSINNIVVDENTPPTLTPSATISSEESYSFSWTGAHINGSGLTDGSNNQQWMHVWIYEDGNPLAVYTRLANGQWQSNQNPLWFTHTIEGTRAYQAKACVNVTYESHSLIPNPAIGFPNCLTSPVVNVQFLRLPGKPSGTPANMISYDGLPQLSWGASTNTVDRYEVCSVAEPNSCSDPDYADVNLAQSWVPANPLGNGDYQLSVRACNAAGCGEAATVVLAVIQDIPIQTRYRYDALGRLIKVDVNDHNKTQYDYDPAGNRQSVEEQ